MVDFSMLNLFQKKFEIEFCTDDFRMALFVLRSQGRPLMLLTILLIFLGIH